MIRELTRDELDRLEPLWHALHAHHAAMADELAPVRDPGESWRRRRAQYDAWLAGGDAAIFVADDEGAAVAYAAVTVAPGPATWDVGEVAAELETLSILPAARGRGVGRALVEAARAWADARGAGSLFVGVAHVNEGALRFYAREGFRPYYVELWRPTARREP